jgi:hypothetical protein
MPLERGSSLFGKATNTMATMVRTTVSQSWFRAMGLAIRSPESGASRKNAERMRSEKRMKHEMTGMVMAKSVVWTAPQHSARVSLPSAFHTKRWLNLSQLSGSEAISTKGMYPAVRSTVTAARSTRTGTREPVKPARTCHATYAALAREHAMMATAIVQRPIKALRLELLMPSRWSTPRLRRNSRKPHRNVHPVRIDTNSEESWKKSMPNKMRFSKFSLLVRRLLLTPVSASIKESTCVSHSWSIQWHTPK